MTGAAFTRFYGTENPRDSPPARSAACFAVAAPWQVHDAGLVEPHVLMLLSAAIAPLILGALLVLPRGTLTAGEGITVSVAIAHLLCGPLQDLCALSGATASRLWSGSFGVNPPGDVSARPAWSLGVIGASSCGSDCLHRLTGLVLQACGTTAAIAVLAASLWAVPARTCSLRHHETSVMIDRMLQNAAGMGGGVQESSEGRMWGTSVGSGAALILGPAWAAVCWLGTLSMHALLMPLFFPGDEADGLSVPKCMRMRVFILVLWVSPNPRPGCRKRAEDSSKSK